MSPAVKHHYDEAIAALKERKDFDKLDLEQVHVWAVGYTIFKDSPPENEALNGVVEMTNNIADILGLPKIP